VLDCLWVYHDGVCQMRTVAQVLFVLSIVAAGIATYHQDRLATYLKPGKSVFKTMMPGWDDPQLYIEKGEQCRRNARRWYRTALTLGAIGAVLFLLGA
jgi:hypothetical protein